MLRNFENSKVFFFLRTTGTDRIRSDPVGSGSARIRHFKLFSNPDITYGIPLMLFKIMVQIIVFFKVLAKPQKKPRNFTEHKTSKKTSQNSKTGKPQKNLSKLQNRKTSKITSKNLKKNSALRAENLKK